MSVWAEERCGSPEEYQVKVDGRCGSHTKDNVRRYGRCGRSASGLPGEGKCESQAGAGLEDSKGV